MDSPDKQVPHHQELFIVKHIGRLEITAVAVIFALGKQLGDQTEMTIVISATVSVVVSGGERGGGGKGLLGCCGGRKQWSGCNEWRMGCTYLPRAGGASTASMACTAWITLGISVKRQAETG